MLYIVRRGKYDIEFLKSITGKEYAITVIGDRETIMVRTYKLTNEYRLEIKKAIAYNDYVDIHSRILYGKKFKNNFETMKRIIDRFFK